MKADAKPIKLTNVPAREDLTDRECAKLLGGLLGGLVTVAPVTSVKVALCWWAEHLDLVDALYDARLSK